MEDIKNRLIIVIIDYGNSDAVSNFNAEDMANYLIETIAELHLYDKYKEEISKR